MCGGTHPQPGCPSPRWGLSPRVRGNPGSSETPSPTIGTIPACAGEPRTAPLRSRSSRDYPRVCGGTPQECRAGPDWPGLSPRVRGNRGAPRRRHDPDGTIPACAGEPVTPPIKMPNSRTIPACAGEPGAHVGVAYEAGDYPRVCGGTRLSDRNGPFLEGLSPRVRGNQHHPRL